MPLAARDAFVAGTAVEGEVPERGAVSHPARDAFVAGTAVEYGERFAVSDADFDVPGLAGRLDVDPV
jgi:hypothetical protein